MPKFILPYEPQATAHREAEQRRRQVKAWLKHIERDRAPSITDDRELVAREPEEA
jgi:hypothetical protein